MREAIKEWLPSTEAKITFGGADAPGVTVEGVGQVVLQPIKAEDGTATTIAGALPVTRPAVVKHLAVLDRAGLVEGRRRGREVRYTVRPERLDSAARWMAGIAEEWDARLAAIKRLAEAEVEERDT